MCNAFINASTPPTPPTGDGFGRQFSQQRANADQLAIEDGLRDLQQFTQHRIRQPRKTSSFPLSG